MPTAAHAPPFDLDRERGHLARRWPKAVRDVLVLAARVERFNRRAAVFGLAPLADPPVAIVDLMWRGLLDAE